MYIPKLDERRKEELMEEIKMLAASFTPDWNYSGEEPDFGYAAAQLFAEMMSGTIEKYNRTAEKNMISFFAELGADRRYSAPAKGYVQLELSGSEAYVTGEYLRKNAVLSATDEEGQRIVYSTSNDVYVINSRITDIFCEDAENDMIFSLCADLTGNVVPAFDTRPEIEQDLQKHRLYFSGDVCGYCSPKTKMRLQFQLDDTEQAAVESLLKAVDNVLYYETKEGFAKCENVKKEGNTLKFSFGTEEPVRKTFHGIESQWFMTELPGTKELSKLYMQQIYLGTEAEALEPDGIFGDNSELTAYRFRPFDINPVPYSAVYFACDSALSCVGSHITLEFRIDYIRNPIRELQENDIDWKHIMKKSQLRKPAEYEVRIRYVIWEYWNGSGWVKLFRDNSYSDVFYGNNDRSIVRIEFDCPGNMAKALLPSGEHFAIRARIVSVENYMKQNGWYITPEISSPSFSYHYISLPTAGYAVTENCLEEKCYSLSGNRSFQVCYFTGNHGRSLYFAFTKAPEYAGIQMLFVCSRNEIDSGRSFVWEYFDGSWKNLSCHDETRGLSRTGLLQLNQNKGFVEKELFGKKRYWIRLRFSGSKSYPEKTLEKICLNSIKVKNVEQRDPEYFYVSSDSGYVCELNSSDIYKACVWVDHLNQLSAVAADEMIRKGAGKPVYHEDGRLSHLWVEWTEWKQGAESNCYILNRENSQVIFDERLGGLPPESDAENVMITYTVCSGAAGNLPAGTTFTLEGNSGLIAGASAPLRLTNGLDRERLHETLIRSAETLRMGSRICSEEDYACAVRHAERNVVRVRAFGGRNHLGEKEYGAVTVAVLLEHMEMFPEISFKIRKYLLESCCANVRPERLRVIPPIPVYCTVTAEIYTENYESVGVLEQQIKHSIESYFDFRRGGDGKGWNIGSLPNAAAIYERICNVSGVAGINGFYLHMTDENGSEIHEREWSGSGWAEMCIPVQKELRLTIQVI